MSVCLLYLGCRGPAIAFLNGFSCNYTSPTLQALWNSNTFRFVKVKVNFSKLLSRIYFFHMQNKILAGKS